MLIKVCGMKEIGNIRKVLALQPDMMGFIFYPLSSRYAGNLEPEKIMFLPVKKVGVFVNAHQEHILKLVERYHIDMIQLHGEETPECCKFFKDKGFQVIKAIGIQKKEDFKLALAYESVCDLLLFDTKSRRYGGTGEVFNWTFLDEYRGKLPFLLSGGISVENIEQLKQIDHPRWVGIDLNSRFEISPGRKDPELLSQFLQVLHT